MTVCTIQMRYIFIVSIRYWPVGNAQYYDKEQAYEAPVLHTCKCCYSFPGDGVLTVSRVFCNGIRKGQEIAG